MTSNVFKRVRDPDLISPHWVSPMSGPDLSVFFIEYHGEVDSSRHVVFLEFTRAPCVDDQIEARQRLQVIHSRFHHHNI